MRKCLDNENNVQLKARESKRLLQNVIPNEERRGILYNLIASRTRFLLVPRRNDNVFIH